MLENLVVHMLMAVLLLRKSSWLPTGEVRFMKTLLVYVNVTKYVHSY